jgi:hypothetical protein
MELPPPSFHPTSSQFFQTANQTPKRTRLHHNPLDQMPRIPPIVIYSLLDNHSSTLKQVNDKLTTPVDVKSKTDRLLLYTKNSADYNILLSEIKSAKLAYHTYPLPEAIQP